MAGLVDEDLVTVMNPHRVSPQSRALLELCRRALKPFLAALPLNRVSVRGAVLLTAAASLRKQPSGISRDRVELPGFSLEVIRAAKSRRSMADGVVLYLHGGAFCLCSFETHRPVVASIAKRTGMPVVSVGYRQMPATDIRGSTQDCLLAYRWLLRRGVDPAKIVFAGDSAGGYLAFATALKAVEVGLPAPAGLIGMSPLLDLDYHDKLAHVNARRDPYIPARSMRKMCRMVAERDGVIDPMLSPVNGALAQLPPVLLIAAEDEVLRCDCELMATRLRAAGVPCAVQVWRGQVHAFPAVAPTIPESRAALASITSFTLDRMADAAMAADRSA